MKLKHNLQVVDNAQNFRNIRSSHMRIMKFIRQKIGHDKKCQESELVEGHQVPFIIQGWNIFLEN